MRFEGLKLGKMFQVMSKSEKEVLGADGNA